MEKRELLEKGTERKDTLMINFEDKRFAEFYPELLDEIYETYLEFLKPGKKPFVFKEGLKAKQLIQVCWNINEYKTKEREIRALLKASKEVKCENLLVITEDYEAEEEIKIKDKFSCKVEFLPLWKWLLENPLVM